MQTAAAEEAIEASEREARESNRDDTLMSALGLGPGQPGGSADNLRLVVRKLAWFGVTHGTSAQRGAGAVWGGAV